MEGNDFAAYTQAITYGKAGNKEKAFEIIRAVGRTNPNDLKIIFWGMYTAPNVERAQHLLDRAKLIDPDNKILPQAEIWLTNEKYKLPHPVEGYSLFPPDRHLGQTSQSQFFVQQEVLPIQLPAAPMPPAYPVQQYYQPAPQMYIVPQPIIIQTAPVYVCPYCRSPMPPITNTRISTGGWITFAVLLIIFFPLCWVGLFSKTSYQYCGQCGVKFN
jgi:hypothetical protein